MFFAAATTVRCPRKVFGSVLLDLKMPKVDGHEVLRQIRAEPSLRGLRVVVLTSSDQDRDRELSRSLGTDGYVVEPASIASLIGELQRCAHLLLPPESPASASDPDESTRPAAESSISKTTKARSSWCDR